jgi:hypothetical protein
MRSTFDYEFGVERRYPVSRELPKHKIALDA